MLALEIRSAQIEFRKFVFDTYYSTEAAFVAERYTKTYILSGRYRHDAIIRTQRPIEP